MKKIEEDIIEKQMAICKKYNADFLASPFNKLIGVAIESFDRFKMPVNGQRHPIMTERSANWYLWAGDYSEADDFFKPLHLEHLLESCPKVLRFLGLAPGWRFLFDNEYEDVWYDANLLNI